MSKIRIGFLLKLNAFLGALIAFFGCNSGINNHGHEIVCEYGCPHSDLVVEGNVTNEAKQPLQNIDINVSMVNNGEFSSVVTDSKGYYNTGNLTPFPADSVKVVATDPNGVYKSDSAQVPTNYENPEGWYAGSAEVKVDFILKKK